MPDPVRPLLLRRLVIVAVGIETGLAVVVVSYCLLYYLLADADPLARHIDRAIAVIVSGLFAFTTAPAAALLLWRRWLWLAAVLAALPVAVVAFQLAG